MPTELDIVIVNWNAGELLRKCICSVDTAAKKAGISVAVTVIDNASHDGSAKTLRADCALNVIWNTRNEGFGRACNQGAAAGVAPYLLFLNPDTEVTADALIAPLQFLATPSHKGYGACGIQLRDEFGQVSRSCARFPSVFQLFCTTIGLAQLLPRWPLGIPMSEWDHQTSRDVDHVIGAYYIIRRDLFVQLAGFDERYFVYFEDLDLSRRMARAGFRRHYLASNSARHVGGGTSRQVKARRMFYSIDSRLTYIQLHFHPLWYVGLLGLVMAVEPVVRLFAAFLKLRSREAGEVLSAYRMLWAKRVTRTLDLRGERV